MSFWGYNKGQILCMRSPTLLPLSSQFDLDFFDRPWHITFLGKSAEQLPSKLPANCWSTVGYPFLMYNLHTFFSIHLNHNWILLLCAHCVNRNTVFRFPVILFQTPKTLRNFSHFTQSFEIWRVECIANKRTTGITLPYLLRESYLTNLWLPSIYVIRQVVHTLGIVLCVSYEAQVREVGPQLDWPFALPLVFYIAEFSNLFSPGIQSFAYNRC